MENQKPKLSEQVDNQYLRFKESIFIDRPNYETLAKWFDELKSMDFSNGTDLEKLIAYYFDCGFCIGRNINPRSCYFDENGTPYSNLSTSTMEGLLNGISIIQKGLLCASFGNSIEFDEKHEKIEKNDSLDYFSCGSCPHETPSNKLK